MDTMSGSDGNGRGVGRDEPGAPATVHAGGEAAACGREPRSGSVRVAGGGGQINANLLFNWRRQMRPTPMAGPPVELIPVEIVGAAQAAPAKAVTAAEPRGAIEITLASGVRVRVDAGVSEAALKRVLSAVRAAA